MDQGVKSGIFGFSLAVFINLFSPISLYFVPSFLAAILAIYVFRLGELRDGLLAAFMTYIFGDGILGTISLAIFYSMNEPYPSFDIDVLTMLYPIVSAITAVIAGYIGVRLAQRRKPIRELPPVI